jgi:hypothetical protein
MVLAVLFGCAAYVALTLAIRRVNRMRAHDAQLRAAQALAAEDGPVTEAELEELRKVWPK